MDKELLQAFEEIRAKLEEFDITEDWLIEHAHGLRDNRLEEDDCLFVIEHLMPFISWYMEVMPLDGFDNLTEWREIPFDVFLKFEREEAKIPEEIISDNEMYELYNDSLAPTLQIPDVHMNMAFFQGQDLNGIKRRAYLTVKGILLIFCDLTVPFIAGATVGTIFGQKAGGLTGIYIGYLMHFSIKSGQKAILKAFT